MENFTPFSALLGGALIGLSATALLLLIGRIAGISGILGGVWTSSNADRDWRVVFLIGIVAGCYLAVQLGAAIPDIPLASTWQLIVGGLLVGVGTAMGNGCTSGHGVCGISRFSIRSIVATLLFMGCAILTVWLMR